MPQARQFDLVLTLRGYSPGQNAWNLEGHYLFASPGNLHNVRERLREIAFPHFQRAVQSLYGMHLALGQIRGRFQLEQLALSPSRTIHVDLVETVYRGKQHYDHIVASDDLPYYPSDETDEEMTPEEEAETERRLLRGHVPGYEPPRSTEDEDEDDDETDYPEEDDDEPTEDDHDLTEDDDEFDEDDEPEDEEDDQSRAI